MRCFYRSPPFPYGCCLFLLVRGWFTLSHLPFYLVGLYFGTFRYSFVRSFFFCACTCRSRSFAFVESLLKYIVVFTVVIFCGTFIYCGDAVAFVIFCALLNRTFVVHDLVLWYLHCCTRFCVIFYIHGCCLLILHSSSAFCRLQDVATVALRVVTTYRAFLHCAHHARTHPVLFARYLIISVLVPPLPLDSSLPAGGALLPFRYDVFAHAAARSPCPMPFFSLRALPLFQDYRSSTYHAATLTPLVLVDAVIILLFVTALVGCAGRRLVRFHGCI